jgi:cephalosporin hydroxylase
MSMNPVETFKLECQKRVDDQGNNEALQASTKDFAEQTIRSGYSYNFTWMGRPIIQYPQDMIAMQEIIWNVKPDLIIETGIAHGGSLIYYASILELIGKGKVLGVDIDIREHNRKEIESHPMYKRIEMIQGSSIADDTVSKVKAIAKDYKTILVSLDSNHTHDHVLRELELYSPLVSVNSYMVVFDTIVEFLPDDTFPDRPWKQGDNPWSATQLFLQQHSEFEIDKSVINKILVSVAPDGYLKRLR